MIKRIFFISIFIFLTTNLFAQDCNGVPCISKPVISQSEKIFCYEPAEDTCVYSYCTPEECTQVCENSYNTYSTPYNVGSNYIWDIVGGQIISTNPSGNIITVLWGNNGIGDLYLEEIDLNGCSRTDQFCVKIISKPIAFINTIPNTNTICQGTNIQFIADNLNPNVLSNGVEDSCSQNSGRCSIDSTNYTYELSYFWDFGDGNTSIEKDPIYAYDVTGNYTITLVISNACQCADTIQHFIEVVNTLGPEITTSCIGTVCQGDTVTYCTNAVSPAWNIEGGVFYNSTNTDNCINIIWDNFDSNLDDGLGSLYLADLNSSCGLAESVMHIPAVPLNPIISGEINPCSNTYQKYSFSCIPGLDYYWQLVGAPWGTYIMDGQGTSEITISNGTSWGSSSYQILLDVSSSSLQCSFGQLSLNIDVLPTLELYGNNVVCEDQVTQYNSWTGNDLEWEVINGTIQTPASSPYIATSIDVIWDQGYGPAIIKATPIASNVFCNSFATYSVEIKETPSEATDIINDILGDTLICPGKGYLYSIVPSNSTSSVNSSYDWNITGGTPTQHNGDRCVISWDPTGPYSIEIANSTSPYPVCSSPSFLKNVFQVPASNPLINGNATSCINVRDTVFLNTLYPPYAEITWGVSDPDMGSIVSGQGTPIAIVEWGDQLGASNITVDVDICGMTLSNTFAVSLVGTNVSFSTPSSLICTQTSVVFTASSSSGDFLWDFGDGSLPQYDSFAPNYTYTNPGNYLVTLEYTDPSGCVAYDQNWIEVTGPIGYLTPNTDQDYCTGNTATPELGIVLAPGSSTPVSWEFFHQGVSVQAGGNTYIANLAPPSYSEAGAYYITLVDANGCNNISPSINLNIISCGGSGPGPPTGGSASPIAYTFSCNSNLGTWDYTFTSPTGAPVDFLLLADASDFSTSSSTSNVNSATYTFLNPGIYIITCWDNSTLVGSQQITVPFVVNWDSYVSCDPANSNQITIQFVDTSSYLLGLTGVTYNWDFGDGNTSILRNPTHIYTAPGVYTVDFTVSYGGASCNMSKDIDSEYDIDFSYSGTQCEATPTMSFSGGATVNFGAVPVLLWQWDFDDGSSSGRISPDRTYSQPGTYNPSLTITDLDGCISNISYPLIIHPTPEINNLLEPNAVCVNDPQINLSTLANYTTTNGEVESWSGPGVIFSSGVYYFDPLQAGAGTHEICITITNNDGCTDYKCVNIIVICPEKPRIFGESEYCFDYSSWNNSQYLQTQSEYSSYEWYINSVLDPGSSSGKYFYNWPGTYDITVSFVDDNGCSTFSDVFLLTIHDAPQPVSISTSSTLCPGSEITLTHNGSQSSVMYYWNTIPQKVTQSVTVIAEPNYEYQVIAVNQFGCESVSLNHVEIPAEVNMCHILSGCFCDSTIINNLGLIEIDGLDNYWMYPNYEWLLNGSSFIPPQNSSSLIIDPLDPNYANINSSDINLFVTDIYGCTYESLDLIIETNCMSCSSESNDTVIVCDSYLWNGITYTTSGMYDSVFYGANIAGCDSIAILHLTINDSVVSTSFVTECDAYLWNGITYDTSGIYDYHTFDINGCDSMAILHLTINHSVISSDTVTNCDSYLWNGINYTTTGIYDTVFLGSSFYSCDSLAILNLTILPSSSDSQLISLCEGDSLFIGSNVYTQSGVYMDILIGSNGCDSLLTTELIVLTNSSSNINPIICDGDVFSIDNNNYFNTGVYIDTLLNIFNCDSVVTTNLLVQPVYYQPQFIPICIGDSIEVGGNYYNTTGLYTDSLYSIYNCDSIIVTDLFVGQIEAELSSNPPLLVLDILQGTPPFSYTIGNQNGILLNSSNNMGYSFAFNPIINGDYYAIVVDDLGCISDTAFFFVDFTHTSISVFDIYDFMIYPNPSRDVFNIKFVSDRSQDFKIRIINTIGEVVFYDDISNFIGNYYNEINLSNYPKAIYFLELETEERVVNKKLILH